MKKRFIVLEGIKTICKTNDKQEALAAMRNTHKLKPSEYHEVHEFNVLGDGLYHGTNQLEPYDCPTCFRSPNYCKCKIKVVLPEGWMSHEEWSNNQTLEYLKKSRIKLNIT